MTPQRARDACLTRLSNDKSRLPHFFPFIVRPSAVKRLTIGHSDETVETKPD